MMSSEGNTRQEMGPQSTGSTGQPNLAAVGGVLTPLTSQMCHILNGIINPLVFARTTPTSFKKCFDCPRALLQLFIEGLVVFGTCHVKTRGGPLLLFTLASGALTPCLLSLRMERDRGRSLAQERLCWLSELSLRGDRCCKTTLTFCTPHPRPGPGWEGLRAFGGF